MKFCTNMYLDNRTNAIQFQGDRWKVISFFVSGPKFTNLFSLNVEKIVVANAVFRFSIG